MIPRYSRPEMAAIWEPANKFRIWFEIEAHACDALAGLGVIPKKAAKAIRKGVGLDLEPDAKLVGGRTLEKRLKSKPAWAYDYITFSKPDGVL